MITRPLVLAPFLGALALWPSDGMADTFAAGSLIVPMDTDYQDYGMFEAYGLVYELVKNDVPVHWVIELGKIQGESDFVASAIDLQTDAIITDHGYRGGPWVIAADDASAARAIIDTWHATYPTVNVHEATASFTGDVAHVLVAAPTIAMLADGNQDIARGYMQAAKIPDSTGDLAWADSSPDMLDPGEVAGATDTNHADGSLFDADGNPVYCQFMSMHWGVADAENNPEVVAEVREFLGYATHFFAECQAVNAFENLDPHGYFLTPNGFEIDSRPTSYDFYRMDTPFGQLDGAFESVGGSEPSYSLPPGDSYKASDIVMITRAGTPAGDGDVWMTGTLDGVCPPPQIGARGSADCLTTGKVSYLGGHEYETALPISTHPKSQGTRLFLNSLFEAPCATAAGVPTINLSKAAPSYTDVSQVTYTLSYENYSLLPALDVVVSDPIPAGATVIAASNGGGVENGEVVWDLGNIAASAGGSVSFTVEFESYGTYYNVAQVTYRAGLNTRTAESNQTETVFSDEPPGDSDGGTDGSTDSDTGDSGDSDTGSEDGGTGSEDGGTGSEGGGTGSEDGGTGSEDGGTGSEDDTGSGDGGSSGGDGGSGTGTGDGADGGDGGGTGTVDPDSDSDVDDDATGQTADDGGADGGAQDAGAADTGIGCGCRTETPAPVFGWLGMLGLVVLRRRPFSTTPRPRR